ncbi:4-hydroxybutyrate coenzyme A transferase [Nilaparvata lugens]|uniref:4-hydroxybutyrate coenzyme A transferase n=1 Tax=Nilaparvata lugens TaxID=108931 RepID=UPI00193DA15E|nr:4-hydroxybutyrate coenzyme A transferase [Nilaparvata lugens]
MDERAKKIMRLVEMMEEKSETGSRIPDKENLPMNEEYLPVNEEDLPRNEEYLPVNEDYQFDWCFNFVVISTSGFGGQVDFIRGASEALDGKGKPIIAMTSTNPKTGDSKIVPFIKEGAGVVTSRAHVHYVVTEQGIASLFGKSLRQRAYHLIEIAHPTHREALEKAAFKRLKCMPAP